MKSLSINIWPKEIVLRMFNERIAIKVPIFALFVTVSIMVSLVTLTFISLTSGSYYLTPTEIFAVIQGENTNTTHQNIIWLFRFPRTSAAIFVGAMMALSGAALQNVTRNELADPSLVGISQGAALTVVTSIIMFPLMETTMRALLAFFGAISITVVIQLLVGKSRSSKSIRFILFGIGLSAFLSSITTAMLTYGDIYRVSEALAWLAGSLDSTNWNEVKILFVTSLILFPSLLMTSRYMSILRLGDESAISLGSPIVVARVSLISLSVALAATATAMVGPVGFIGLIAPHAAKRIATSGVGMHLVMSGLLGGLLLLSADLIGRTWFSPFQIPAGLLTQIIGVPFFIFLLMKRKTKLS